MGQVVPIKPKSVATSPDPPPVRTVIESSREMRREATQVMRDTTRGPVRSRPQLSGQIDTIWGHLYTRGVAKAPEYDPWLLARMPQFSTILPQCIRALRVGIHGYGFDFSPAVDAKDEQGNEELLQLMEREKKRGERFFRYSSLRESFTSQRFALGTDMFTIGWGGLEVLRDTRTQRAAGLEHVPAATLRIGFSDPEPVLVRRKILSEDGKRYEVRPSWERLRRYVQIHEGRQVFFKELGDPRFIDRCSGEVVKPVMESKDYANPSAARELMWFTEYNPADPNGYGLPPWIGASIMVGGERKADVVNWDYFSNKSVPPLAVLVSGGALTQQSRKNVEENWEKVKGIDNFHKAVILEAEPVDEGTATDLAPGRAMTTRIDLKPLTDAQHGDALFQNYKSTARDNVRSACGVPPILIGESSDYTRATAQVAMQVAETFMFGPLRNEFDDQITRHLLPALELRYWFFKSGTPDLANVEDIAKVIEVGVKAGVGNPNVYSRVLESILGVELPQNDAPWAQFPVDLVKIALQSGLVTMDFEEDGQLKPQVNEEARERFKETVGQVLESAIERVLLRAQQMAG